MTDVIVIIVLSSTLILLADYVAESYDFFSDPDQPIVWFRKYALFRLTSKSPSNTARHSLKRNLSLLRGSLVCFANPPEYNWSMAS